MNAKAFRYSFEGQKGMVERWVEMRICVCPRKPLNPKLIHVQKRRRRHLEGVHRPRFARGVSWSSILSTWALYFDTFQQLAFRWGEWKIKCVSPVVGIDGKNPKSRAVPGGFTSTCGQESASSMGQTTKATEALTLEDQSGLFQHWGVRKCWSNFHSCVQSPFHLLQRSGSGTRNWPKGAGNMSDWAVSFVCFLSFLFLKHISTSKNSNWIPGLVSRLNDSHVWSQVELLWDMAWFFINTAC